MQPLPFLLSPRRLLLFTVFLLFLASTPGCAHRKNKGGSSTLSGYGPESGLTSPGRSESWTDAGFGDYAENIPLTGRPNQIHFDSPQVRRDLFDPVYFPFDRYEIGHAEYPKVQRIAEYLRARSSSLIIAGHTDSTGTADYNRNLGELRALSVRAALIQQGVSPSRVQTVSFGEDRPAVAGSSSSAHAANRRAEFGLFESVSP